MPERKKRKMCGSGLPDHALKPAKRSKLKTKSKRYRSINELKAIVPSAGTHHQLLKSSLWRRLLVQDFKGAAEVLTILLNLYNWDYDVVTKGCVEVLTHLAPEESIIRFHRKFITLASASHRHIPDLILEVAFLFVKENDFALAYDHLSSHMTQPYSSNPLCLGFAGLFAFILAKRALNFMREEPSLAQHTASEQQTLKKIDSFRSTSISFLRRALERMPGCDAFLFYLLKCFADVCEHASIYAQMYLCMHAMFCLFFFIIW
jgi:hypothetical protein